VRSDVIVVASDVTLGVNAVRHGVDFDAPP